MEGFIEALQIQREKGLPFDRVSSFELVEGKGILGDCHCIGGEKQIALISSETIHWITTQAVYGLCFSRFQGNIVTQGIDYSLLNQGDYLLTDQVKIELASYAKRCFSECRRIQEKLSCELRTGIVFAKVLQSGKVYVGDRIQVM